MGKFWSKQEEDVLKQLWDKEEISYEDILKVFVERPGTAIEKKAYSLGLKTRSQRIKTKLDEDYLRKLLEVTEG